MAPPRSGEVDGVGAVLIEFRVGDARAAGGELNISPVHAVEPVALAALCAFPEHRVPVRQLPREDVAEDLEIPVRVSRESRVGLDAVLH